MGEQRFDSCNSREISIHSLCDPLLLVTLILPVSNALPKKMRGLLAIAFVAAASAAPVVPEVNLLRYIGR